jgi:hypothetical protein
MNKERRKNLPACIHLNFENKIGKKTNERLPDLLNGMIMKMKFLIQLFLPMQMIIIFALNCFYQAHRNAAKQELPF